MIELRFQAILIYYELHYAGMITSIIESILMKHVGKYLSGVEKNSFDVGLLDGDIVIENVGLNNKLFEELGLPITLKFSNIDKLLIQVPWTKLDKERTVVLVTGVNVLITMEDIASNNQSTGVAYKFNKVITWIRDELKKKDSKQQKEISLQNDSFSTKMLLRIIDNLEVNIHNIHIRLEDAKTFQNQQFSLGYLIDSINAYTVDEHRNKSFYSRSFSKKKKNEPMVKSVQVSPMNAYWNPKEKSFIKDAVDAGLSKAEIVWLMRAPFPKLRHNIPPLTQIPSTVSETKIVSSTSLEVQKKQKPKQKQTNFFTELFKPRSSTKHAKKDDKDKGHPQQPKQKTPQKPVVTESPKKPSHNIQPIQDWKFQFKTICTIGVSAQLEMNDLKDKDTPLLEISVSLDSIEIRSNQLVLGQLFCILQHFLKYVRDIYFFENRSLICNTTLEQKNKGIFNCTIENILKSNKKVKKFDDLHEQHFKSHEQKQIFLKVLQGYSIKKLESFAQGFMFEFKLKKQIQKVNKGQKNKQKAEKDIKKFMQKLQNSSKKEQQKDQETDIKITSTNRAIFQLKMSMAEANCTVDYITQQLLVDSLNLVIRGFFCQLRFVKPEELDLLLKIQDIIITYTSSANIVIPLNKNILEKEETLVNFIVCRRPKQLDITGQIQRKLLFISDQIVGFVVHFFQDLRVGPFMLNLLVEKAQINIDKLNILLKLLLESIKNTKCEIRIHLPILDIQMKQFGLLIDGGTLALKMPDKQGISLKLLSAHLTLTHGTEKYQFLSDICLDTNLQRRLKNSKSEDLITLTVEKVSLNAPPISTIDLLAIDISALVDRISSSFRKLVDRKRQLLSRKVKYNNHILDMDMFMNGESLEFVESQTGRIYKLSVFKARVYPLVHNSKHYLVIVKQANIDYIELSDPHDIAASSLNDRIDQLSTQQQLDYFWLETDKYEQAVVPQNLTHNHHNLMIFVQNIQKSSKQSTSKLYQLHFIVKDFTSMLNDLFVHVKRTELRSVRLSHTQELQMFVNKVTITLGDMILLEMSGTSTDFLHLKYNKVVSENCEINLENATVSLSEKLVTPVLQLISRMLSMRIVEEAKRKAGDTPPDQLGEHRIFSIKQRDISATLKRLDCNFFTAEMMMENISGRMTQQTNYIDFKGSISRMDICDFIKIPSVSLSARVSQVQGLTIAINLDSSILEVNPTLFEKYLAIVKTGAVQTLSNFKHLKDIQRQIQKLSIYNRLRSQKELSIRFQNVQIQVVLNQNNALVLCLDEAHLRWELIPPHPGYFCTFSIMRLHLERIHQIDSEQMQFTILKPMSFSAKGQITADQIKQAHMALTKVEMEINFQYLQFLFMVLQKYIVIYGQNPWLGGFLRELADIQERKVSFNKKVSEVNTQIDQISIIYLHDNGVPLLKTLVKIPSRRITINPNKTQIELTLNFQTNHFNSTFKIYEPLIENSTANLTFKKTTSRSSKSIANAQCSIKTIRMNVSKDFMRDAMHLAQKFKNYLQDHRNRFLEVKFYLDQILGDKGKVVTAQESPTTLQSKKQRILIENMRLNSVVLKEQAAYQQKHAKNYIRVSNMLGIDVTCELNYLYTDQKKPAFTVHNAQSHIIPMSIECDYSQNYQVLERLRKMIFLIKIHDQIVLNRAFNIATFLSQILYIPPKEGKPGVSIYLQSELSEDEYIITFTTAKKVENTTGQNLFLSFKDEGIDCNLQLPSGGTIFMPYFVKNSFFISIKDSKQVFLLNFSKADVAQEIELPGPDQQKHIIIMHSKQSSGIQVISLSTALEVMNHFNVYISLTIDRNTLVIEPNKVVKTTAMSLHEGVHMIKVSIPSQTEQGIITIDNPQKLMKEREVSCYLTANKQVHIKFYLLLSGEPHCRYLQIYPRMSFINQTPQKLWVFTALYGGVFPVEKIIKDNSEDYEKLSLVILQNAVRMRFKPTRTCFVLDNERYLHIGLRNSKKGMSEELVAYESDFRKTISAEDQNLIYKYCVKYQQTKVAQEISTFKTRLLPKFYLINRTDFTLQVFENTKVPPNQMIVMPFNKDGCILMALQSKDSTVYHQLTPVRLVENGQIKYDTKFNFGFINPENFSSDQKEYSQNLIVKMELELVFHDSLGYYIMNRKTKQLLIRNKLTDYRITVKDCDDESVAIIFVIAPQCENDIFAVYSNTMTLLIDQDGQTVFEEKVDFSKPLAIEDKLQELPINIKEHYQNNLRVIQFRSIEDENDAQEISQQSITSVGKFGLDTFILSAIFDDFSGKRKEILRLQVDKTSLTLLNYQTMKIIQAKVANLIVASNETHGNHCLLKKRITKQEKQVDFVTLFMQAIPYQKLVENFKMEFAPLSIYLTEEIIELIVRNLNSFAIVSSVSIPTHLNLTYNSNFNEFYQLYSKKRQGSADSSKNTIKLQNLLISAIQIELSFKQVHFQGNKQYMKSFGFSFVDIDKARLSLSELKIKDAQQSQQAFIAAIASSYYKESLGLAFGALGGMNIIGNPKQFILEIRTGVGRYDSGIVRGTGGLIRGVTAGTANAVSKIMGSLGNGIGSLSLDDHYLTERQTIKQRQVNGFMDGLSSSGLSIYKGFECGITGLVRQPLQGMKQDGSIGAFKGFLKGVTGLVTKPLTGIIDATSKTAQGITVVSKLTKRQAYGDEWFHPLYFMRNIIRQYDDVDEMCLLYLRKFLPNELINLNLVKCFLLQNQDPHTLVEMLVIGLKEMLQIDINARTITLRVPSEMLSATAKFSEGVVLYYIDQSEGDEQIEIVLRLKRNHELKHLLYLTLQKVIETFKSGE